VKHHRRRCCHFGLGLLMAVVEGAGGCALEAEADRVMVDGHESIVHQDLPDWDYGGQDLMADPSQRGVPGRWHGQRVTWDQWKPGLRERYSPVDLAGDFGGYHFVVGDPLLVNHFGWLKVQMRRQAVGPNVSGVGIQVPIPGRREYVLRYRFQFDKNTGPNYDFTVGGKLPGLGGGRNYTGGQLQSTMRRGDGFSARVMWWGKDNNRWAVIAPYLYYADMPTPNGDRGPNYGHSLGLALGRVDNDGKPHIITIKITMNTGERADGEYWAQLDQNPAVWRGGMRWMTRDHRIDTLHFTSFHGGASDDYAPDHDQFVNFDWIELQP
jgi:hypothetical protein